MITYTSVEQIHERANTDEFLSFRERDPCYTWLFPLRLGPFDPAHTWRPSQVPRVSDNLTLYIHVPYCRYVCAMCPFTHEALGKKGLSAYTEAVIKEIGFFAHHPALAGRQVTTLYFGGGTASSLKPDQVRRLIDAVQSGYRLSAGCQITLECHPRTVDRDYLVAALDGGVNRISFGIQSFKQHNIDSLRLHQRVDQSRRIIATAMQLGFETVAIDLMYRFPGQTVAALQEELDIAIDLGPQGLSLYALDPEVRAMDQIASAQPAVAVEEAMYYAIHDRLDAEGFVQVAQPDWARPGHENQQLYDLWGAPQAENIGFGAGAFSEAMNGTTWCNIHDPEAYLRYLNRGDLPVLMGQVHSWDDAAARYPALGVRCLQVPFEPFRDTFGVDLGDIYRFELAGLVRRGLVSIDDDALHVSRQGKFFIDNISKAFFNLANRGLSQLWGVQLKAVEPEIIRSMAELLDQLDQGAWA